MSLDRIRTDVVGSLLRPADWKQARLAFETGKMSAEDFAREPVNRQRGR